MKMGFLYSVETDISVYSESVADVLGTAVLNLNPDEEESTPGRKDASVARGYLSDLETSVINLGILTDGYDKFMEEAEKGLAFLENAYDKNYGSLISKILQIQLLMEIMTRQQEQ